MRPITALLTLCTFLSTTTVTFTQEVHREIIQKAEGKEILPEKFLGRHEGSFWYLGRSTGQRYDKGKLDLSLLKMDQDLKLLATHPLKIEQNDVSFEGKALLHHGVVYVLLKEGQPLGSKSELYLNRYDMTGKQLSTSPILGKRLKPVAFSHYTVLSQLSAVSPDSNWLYLCLWDKNASTSDVLSLDLRMLDLERDTVHRLTVSLKEKPQYVEHLAFFGNNEGETLLLYQSNYKGPLKRQKKKKKSYPANTSKLLKFSLNGVQEELMLYQGNDLIRTAMAKVTKNRYLHYVDLQSVEESKTTHHTYNVKRVDLDSFKIIQSVSNRFEAAHFANLPGFDLMAEQYGPPVWSIIEDIFPAEDGTMKLVLQHAYIPRRSSSTADPYTYYFHEAILVASLDKTGVIDWSVTLPYGLLLHDGLREDKLLIKEKNDALFVFFNASPKILNNTYTELPKAKEAQKLIMPSQIPTATGFFIVGPDGHYTKQPLFEDIPGSGYFDETGDLSDNEFSFSILNFHQPSPYQGAFVKVKL